MRTIKFRGKKLTNGVWAYGSLVYLDKNGAAIYVQTDNGSEKVMDLVYVDPDTVCQFTGFLDKNGKEIYEGDIVESISGKVGYVIFLQQEMGYVVVWDNCDTRLGHRNRGEGYEYDGSIEVIGNIYDNPELINKEE